MYMYVFPLPQIHVHAVVFINVNVAKTELVLQWVVGRTFEFCRLLNASLMIKTSSDLNEMQHSVASHLGLHC